MRWILQEFLEIGIRIIYLIRKKICNGRKTDGENFVRIEIVVAFRIACDWVSGVCRDVYLAFFVNISISYFYRHTQESAETRWFIGLYHQNDYIFSRMLHHLIILSVELEQKRGN